MNKIKVKIEDEKEYTGTWEIEEHKGKHCTNPSNSIIVKSDSCSITKETQLGSMPPDVLAKQLLYEIYHEEIRKRQLGINV